MNILFLCHRFPYPPRRGGKIRPFHIIRHLAASGHNVTVGSLARSDQEAAQGAGLAAYCQAYAMGRVRPFTQALRMLARLPTATPSSMGYFYSAALQSQVSRLLEQRSWDLILVHCSSAAQYVARVQGIPKLLDFGDMDSQKWLHYARFHAPPLSWGYRLEGRKLQACEQRLACQFDLCTTSTPHEWQTLQGYGLQSPGNWFPNGVDSCYFQPGDDVHDANTLCFVGRMDYYPNQQAMLHFCAQVWPGLKASRPALRLLIVGAEPSLAVRRLARLPGVSVTGWVEDVRPYVRRAALMVAPLLIAHGTQNKILESMALGVPVLTSSLGARGVDAHAGEHLLVADSAESQQQAILDVLQQPRRRAQLAQAGLQRVRQHHSWEGSMQRLDAILERRLAA